MGPRRRAIGRTLAIVLILIVIAIGTIAFVFYNSQVGAPPGSSTSSSTSSEERTVTSSNLGIQLTASTNTTAVVVGHKLNIAVGLFNTLPEMNNVSTEDDLSINGFPIAVWGPCAAPLPFQFVIVSGNYSLANLKAMTTNSSAGEAGYTCTAGAAVKFVVFQPDSDQANLTGTVMIAGEVPHQPLGTYHVESNFSVAGYWGYPLSAFGDSGDLYTPTGSGSSFQYPEVGPLTSHAFVPGVYTLAVADEWGQTVVIHFTVAAPATPGCIQLESEPLFLTVRNGSSGHPFSHLEVQVKESTPADLCSPSGPSTTENLGAMYADVNGTIEVCCTGSTFFFSIPYLNGSYFGSGYSVNSTATGAESVQCVTLSLPGGSVTTTYGAQFQDHC